MSHSPVTLLAVGASTLVIVLAGALVIVSQRSQAPAAAAPPRSAPVVTPAAGPPAPPRETPDEAAAAELAAATTIARQIDALRGEALVGALWQIEQRAQPVTYAQLERNAERYRGQVAVFAGKVLQIQDSSDGMSFIRLGTGPYDSKVLAVITVVPPSDDVVAGRRVRVYGELSGTHSYRSQAAWDITIPRLTAVAVVPASVPRRAPRP